MKNSFKLPLIKHDLLNAIKARNEYNINISYKKNPFNKSELKKIIETTKKNKQNIILYFNEEKDNEVKLNKNYSV
jgi:hypothetical protein